MLVKRQSSRLPNKNILPINGIPMYIINLEKCLGVFDKVYVTTDDYAIYKDSAKSGAIPIQRPKELVGDTPNIPVYKHAMETMKCDAFVAVQANSPTIDIRLIEQAKATLEKGAQEVITVHPDGSIYGSCWGMTRERLENYKDAYNPSAEVKIEDPSIDVHIEQDYNLVVNQLSNG